MVTGSIPVEGVTVSPSGKAPMKLLIDKKNWYYQFSWDDSEMRR